MLRTGRDLYILYGLLVLLLFLLCSCSGPVGNKHVPEPRIGVNLDSYMGLWYEIARYPNGFEKDCVSVTAYYERTGDKVSIINRCRKFSSDGRLSEARGKAKLVSESDNTKFKVSFFGPFYFGDYWILDHSLTYSWSIVGEPSGRYLWILSRTAEISVLEKKYLLLKLKSMGYNTDMIYFTPQ